MLWAPPGLLGGVRVQSVSSGLFGIISPGKRGCIAVWSGMTIVWTQATATTSNALASLALRRWFSSLTLSSPEAVPSRFGLWTWLAGLAALVLLPVVFQGPRRALGQMLDVPGHLRLAGGALGRLKRAWRV